MTQTLEQGDVLTVQKAGFSIFSTSNDPLTVTPDWKIKLPKKPQLFNVITGPRGSLKTLLLTKLATRDLMRCFYLRYYGIIRHVWTNYPIGYYHKSIVDGKWYYLKSEPLNMESLMTFEEGMAAGKVYVDEVDQWYDRQDWAQATQKLLNAVITQIRKRELSLNCTTQNFQWLNARAQFQTDILVNCREASFTPWGRKNRVQPGMISFLTLKDLSGVSTGYRFDENQRVYSTMLTHGDRMWNCYDTNYQFDPTETKARYKIKTDAKTIRLGADGYKVEQTDGELLQSQSKNEEIALFSHVVEDLKAKGIYHVKPATIWAKAGELGWDGETYRAGKILSKLGVSRTTTGYTLMEEQNGPSRYSASPLVDTPLVTAKKTRKAKE